MLSLAIFFGLLTIIALLFITLPLIKTTQVYKLVLLICIVSVASMSSYYYLGSVKQYQDYVFLKEHSGDVKKMMTELKNPQQVIKRLERQVRLQPNKSQGWFLLGRLYFVTGQYAKAVESLRKANELQPGNINTMEHYVEAIFINNQQHLNPEAKRVLQDILSKRVDDPKALYLLGLDAFVAKQYQQAASYWKRILPQLEPQSAEQQTILQAIAKAEQLST